MTKSLIAEWRREDTAPGGPQSSAAPARPYSLTVREVEVLTWVARGKSASAIGEMLHITKRTVDAHASSIVSKIGAVNRTQAVAIAIRDRLIKM
jgi:LuxR family transcriptional regulator, quorum-sensing system regulator BjaR1